MATGSSSSFPNSIADAVATLNGLKVFEEQLTDLADLLVQIFRAGHKLLVCGNGGSAADAADFCTEFACRFESDRDPYFALNLAQGGSLITATANDYGFAEIFARQVRAFGKPGDILIAISTSGKSENIRRALEQAKAGGLKTVALLGRDGGSAGGIADSDLIVSGHSTARIQEAHKFLLHVLCELCEQRLKRT